MKKRYNHWGHEIRPSVFLDNDDHKTGTGDQHQQQQQQDEVNDPFKDIDLDLVDDTTKAAILKAREELKKLPNAIKQMRGFQANHDKLQAQLQQLQQQIQKPTQQQQQVDDEDETVKEITAKYLALGMTPEVAKQNAVFLADVLKINSRNTTKQIQETVEPIAASACLSEATVNFSEIQQVDSRFQIPEVAQGVWDRVKQNAQDGRVMTPEMIRNLGRVVYMTLVDEGKLTDTNLQQMQKPIKQQQQQTTRFSFPGATAVKPSAPVKFNNKPELANLDPETAAAVEVTKGLMQKAFERFGTKKK